MKFHVPEPEIELYRDVFEENDILHRREVSESLSDLVERIDDPVVIALNGRWGTGKSHFLKRWVGAHTLQNRGSATTVYFDAFAQDYISDPLPALIGALATRIPEAKKSKIENVKSVAYNLLKPAARIGLALATYGATEAFGTAGDVVVDVTRGEASAALENFWAAEQGRQAAIQELRESIQALAASVAQEESSGASLVIVVDELDRCRPDYALEVLEVIKHFFDVPRVHFILGVNLEALGNSVAARYGNDIDADAYLRKFVNIVLTLPNDLGPSYRKSPAAIVYFQHFAKEMKLPNHITEALHKQLKLAAKGNPTSIRDVGKILSRVSLITGAVIERERWLQGWMDVMATVIVSSVIRPDLHQRLLKGRVDDNDLLGYFGATKSTLVETIGNQRNPEYDRSIWWAYMHWQYIFGDGKIDDADERLVGTLAASFGEFRDPHEVKGIPQKIQSEWLDLFQLKESRGGW
jgi:hypothetical protein